MAKMMRQQGKCICGEICILETFLGAEYIIASVGVDRFIIKIRITLAF